MKLQSEIVGYDRSKMKHRDNTTFLFVLVLPKRHFSSKLNFSIKTFSCLQKKKYRETECGLTAKTTFSILVFFPKLAVSKTSSS